ncbi:hypothetical protein ACW9HQ_39430 [Nocardia gipuzkoensis]
MHIGAAVGDTVRTPHASGAQIGYVIAHAPTADQAVAAARAAKETIEIVTRD